MFAMSTFTGGTNMATMKPEVVLSHVVVQRRNSHESVDVFKDGLSTGVNI